MKHINSHFLPKHSISQPKFLDFRRLHHCKCHQTAEPTEASHGGPLQSPSVPGLFQVTQFML